SFSHALSSPRRLTWLARSRYAVPDVDGLDITMWPLYFGSTRSSQVRGAESFTSCMRLTFTAKATVTSVTPCHMFCGWRKRGPTVVDSLATYGSSSPLLAAPVR